MFKLDDNLLKELGLGTLPPEEKNKMLAHIYETLEMRVGMKLAEKMTNEQLDEFESFIDKNDEAGALKWLEGNFPDYKQVVADELEALKNEIRQSAPQILEAVQREHQMQAAAPPLPPQSQQQPYPTQYYQTPPPRQDNVYQFPQQPQQPPANPYPYQAPPMPPDDQQPPMAA